MFYIVVFSAPLPSDFEAEEASSLNQKKPEFFIIAKFTLIK